MKILQAHAVSAPHTERLPHGIGMIMDVDRYLLDSKRMKITKHVGGVGLSGDGNQRLGDRKRQGIETGAKPPRQNHSLETCSGKWSRFMLVVFHDPSL
jgi:hypothetical protein